MRYAFLFFGKYLSEQETITCFNKWREGRKKERKRERERERKKTYDRQSSLVVLIINREVFGV